MRKKLLLIGTFLGTTILLLQGSLCFADLNAGDVASRFNAMNGGKGYYFKSSTAGGRDDAASNITGRGGDALDLSAYSPLTKGGSGNTAYFVSFCVEPRVVTAYGYDQVAKLNYANNKTSTSLGSALTMGTAVLYSMYAKGTLGNFDYTNSKKSLGNNLTTLQDTIWFLMGRGEYDLSYCNWYDPNIFLQQLLAINGDKNYWKTAYDPGKFYSEIGDYSLFVMNNYTTVDGEKSQDYIYMASAINNSPIPPSQDPPTPDPTPDPDPTPVVPEPATLALWGIASILLPIGHKFRKRMCKTNDLCA